MSKLIKLSLDVTAIPRESIKPHTNGKKYIALDVWINDEEDRFGNNCSVNIEQTKEEREAKAKKVYIGNGKTKLGFDGDTKAATKPSAAVVEDDDCDDGSIPF